MSLTTIIIETSEHRHRLQSLLPGTEYKLRISAHNRAGWSAWSSIATVRTKSDVPNRPNAPKVISSLCNSHSLDIRQYQRQWIPMKKVQLHGWKINRY